MFATSTSLDRQSFNEVDPHKPYKHHTPHKLEQDTHDFRICSISSCAFL